MRGTIAQLSQHVTAEAFVAEQPLAPPEIVLAQYTFLPHARSGIAAALTTPFSWDAPVRADVSLSVPVIADNGQRMAGVPLTVRGPIDVVGLDPAQVIRTYPQHGQASFEAEDLVHIEFDRPDLPWLFTPTAPDANGRLVPWMSLVVVTQRVGALTVGRPGTLPVLRARQRELQPLGDAWAWAHAQVMGPKPAANDPQRIASIQRRLAPENAAVNLSRVLCPRRLEPNKAYIACVVPTFAAGAQAGLGLEITETTLAPAWTHGADPDAIVTLPVYFSFSFTTGEEGNFESLARLLRPAAAPPGVGRRRIDTSNPGNGINPLEKRDTGREQVMEGPLVSLSAPPTDVAPDFWPSEARQQWPAGTTNALRTQLNAPEVELLSATEPVAPPAVTPPRYADKHIARTRLDGTEPSWFHQLNLDPRNRVVAGLGTRVVQMDQETLMASAWNQVSGLGAANGVLKLAQFARYVAASIHRRHLIVRSPAAQLAVTHRLHARVMADPVLTVRARLQASALPIAVTSGAFQRFIRARGPIGRFVAPDLAERPALVTQLVAGADHLTRDYVRTYTPPDSVAKVSTFAQSAIPDQVAMRVFGGAAAEARRALEQRAATMALQPSITGVLTEANIKHLDLQGPGWLANAVPELVLQRLLQGVPDPDKGVETRQQALLAAGRAVLLRTFVDAMARREDWWSDRRRGPRASSGELLALAERLDDAASRFEVREHIGYERGLASRLYDVLRGSARIEGQSIAASLTRVANRLVVAPEVAAPARPRVLITDLSLAAKLHPAITVTARIKGRLLKMPDWLAPGWFDDGRVEPVMAAPSFAVAMCEALARYDRSWMIPGVATMDPPNLVTLLQTNARFVEAFLIGLNHEMARELLWRGYPTDQRGTYFKSFWSGQDELLQPIHKFTPAALGDHLRADLKKTIVLLIRGELIRRYPGVIARAVREQSVVNGVPRFGTDPGAPTLFRVMLAPDILLVGFTLTPEQVRGPGPRWWFTLAENPTEPRFGLDDGGASNLSKRNDLTWADFGIPDPLPRTREFLTTTIPTGLSFEGAVWGRDGAAVAHLLFQLPARAAFLGTRMVNETGA